MTRVCVCVGVCVWDESYWTHMGLRRTICQQKSATLLQEPLQLKQWGGEQYHHSYKDNNEDECVSVTFQKSVFLLNMYSYKRMYYLSVAKCRPKLEQVFYVEEQCYCSLPVVWNVQNWNLSFLVTLLYCNFQGFSAAFTFRVLQLKLTSPCAITSLRKKARREQSLDLCE